MYKDTFKDVFSEIDELYEKKMKISEKIKSVYKTNLKKQIAC